MEGLVSWRGADLTTELYVGNVSTNVSVEEAKQAIIDLGVEVIELEVIRRHNHFQSFRLRVKRTDFEKMKDPDIWPDGIVIRRFFRGKRNGAETNDGHDGGAIIS